MNDFKNELAKELVKQVPIKDVYDDVAKESLKSTGNILGLIPRTINCALEPLHKWVLHKEHNIEMTKALLNEKLAKVNSNEIVTPEPYIGVPAVQAISYCEDNEMLRDLYANLLASSMTKSRKDYVHPSYVDIIKQLSSDEAKILKCLSSGAPKRPIVSISSTNERGLESLTILEKFTPIGEEAGCKIIELVPMYLDNLSRLKLVEVDFGSSFSDTSIYNPLIESEICQEKMNVPLENGRKYTHRFGIYYLTQYAKEFCRICM